MWAIVSNAKDGAKVPAENIIRRPRPVEVKTGKQSVQHPAAIFRAWSAEQLAKAGIYPVQPAPGVDSSLYSVKSEAYAFDKASGHVVQKTTVKPRPLDILKSRRKAEVNALRGSKVNGGFAWKHGGKNHVVDSDEASRRNLSELAAALSAGLGLPGGGDSVPWSMRDNSRPELDEAGLRALVGAMRDHVGACYAAAWKHKDAIERLKKPETVVGYDIEVGWPETPA